jgi:serine/threonine protein kinase/Tol biopolymer transport system component
MTAERWAQIKSVFQAAVEVNDAERCTFVDEACGSDTDLRREVMRLLEHHRHAISVEPPRDLSGRTISHYKIIEKLGEGGMGVVYKAEDTKLFRTVALKFLRADSIGSEEPKTRLLLEARAAASLDHPNICTVYDIEEAEGHTFLVMGHVNGVSLSDRIRQRPIPLGEALRIAAQIADGLHAAHESGIVHRDIKSANVFITEKGHVKIMDFGLAHLAAGTRITKTGTIMGTPAYMSPEQVRGADVDHRTDIWSLGIVLYEMITGRFPFRGESPQTIALAIQNEDAEPVTALRSGLPLDLDFIVDKALAKNRAERYQHVDEFRIDLETVSKRNASATSSNPRSATALRVTHSTTSVPGSTPRLRVGLAAVTALALLGVTFARFRESRAGTPEVPLRRFSFAPPVAVRADWGGRNVAISPNGKHIAIAAAGKEGKLWLQDLSRGQSTPIEGTEGAETPFWSPDSQYVGYAASNELMKVRVDGGAPTRVCVVKKPRFHGATWSPDGEAIVFASDELFEVPASGGVAKPLQLPDGSGDRKYHPWFLPSQNGARVLLFAGGSGTQNLYLYNFQNRQLKVLGPGSKPTYSASGHLVYQPTEFVYELWAIPFSLEKLGATGKQFVIGQRALEATVAADGTLVYREPRGSGRGGFTWVDRDGKELKTIELQPVSSLYALQLSPDDRLVAYSGRSSLGVELDVWLYDFIRGRNIRLTTDPGRDLGPVWAPSGEHVAFTSNRSGSFNIYLRRADGSGETMRLTDKGNSFVSDWSRDGRYLLYEETATDPSGDLWFLERDPSNGAWRSKPFISGHSEGERVPRISPDGRFVAYLSNETGREELYVRPFPQGTGRWTVSTSGTFRPAHWRGDGRELYYLSQGALICVPVSTRPGFTMGSPTKLFSHSGAYAAASDGQRFLLATPEEEALEPMIRVVQNWFAEFRDRR